MCSEEVHQGELNQILNLRGFLIFCFGPLGLDFFIIPFSLPVQFAITTDNPLVSSPQIFWGSHLLTPARFVRQLTIGHRYFASLTTISQKHQNSN